MSLTRTSFDGGVRAKCVSQSPDRYSAFLNPTSSGNRITVGSGLSYAAASFHEKSDVFSTRRINRIIGFNLMENLLIVESGVTFRQIFHFLSSHQLVVLVQPGHPDISVGGAVAADIHGKNQSRDGNFKNVTESLLLAHPEYGFISCDRNTNEEIFNLTCGGYGLTGHILQVTLRLTPLPSQIISKEVYIYDQPNFSVDAMSDLAQENDYLYSWHDLSPAKLKNPSHFMVIGKATSETESRASNTPEFKGGKLSPKHIGPALMNKTTINLMNWGFSNLLRLESKRGKVKTNVFDAIFTPNKKMLYFSLFGNRGFHEYQFIISEEQVELAFQAIRNISKQLDVPLALASGKIFGGQQELLRFNGKGFCLAINIPRKAPNSEKFMTSLDSLLIELKGIPNIIKDSRLPRTVFEELFPEADLFRSRLKAFDKKRLFKSELSERLFL